MCAIDDAEPCDLVHFETRTARKVWRCEECRRHIQPGERYEQHTFMYDQQWSRYRVCRHCQAAATWMRTVCGGYLTGDLSGELREHWDEGYRAFGMGRLIVGMRRRWSDGADPVPTGVRELAEQMMQEKVAP